MTKKGQSAKEYLIILITVILISLVITLFAYFGDFGEPVFECDYAIVTGIKSVATYRGRHMCVMETDVGDIVDRRKEVGDKICYKLRRREE